MNVVPSFLQDAWVTPDNPTDTREVHDASTGELVATVSTLFVASPLYAVLRGTEDKVREQERLVRETAKPSAEKEPVAS